MQVKKNPQADLNRNSGLYFVIGLATVLFITWRALEYKTYPTDQTVTDMVLAVEELSKEDIPEDWECPECGVTKEDFEMVELAA